MTPELSAELSKVCAALQTLTVFVKEQSDEVVATNDHIEVIRHYNELRNSVELVRIARKKLDEIEDRLSHKDVPDVMRHNQIKTITVEGVGRVSIGHKFTCTMPDKVIGMNWLRENGHEGLIQETVNSSTLAAFAKDMLQNQNIELPPDKFKTSIMAYTSITRG